ncbi:MAG: hypothetical protein GY937_11155 [bacterium]|nr:hypothetical protein [bacterium]
MRENRTYATEDSDLVLEFECNGELMGAVLELPADDAATCSVTVSDASDANASFVADLFWGAVDPRTADNAIQLSPDVGHLQAWELDGGGALAFDAVPALGAPEFLYVRVEQHDGDRAWSAPVWINHDRNYAID